jgi:hypothetical protein
MRARRTDPWFKAGGTTRSPSPCRTGPLDASFNRRISDDGDSFAGGWRPNSGADADVNIPYDVSGTRVT